MDSFWRSVDRSETPVDHAAFSRLTGHDREWAVSYLLQELWLKPELAADLAALSREPASTVKRFGRSFRRLTSALPLGRSRWHRRRYGPTER